MIDHLIDEERILIDEVSDEALEAAAGFALGGFPTLPPHILLRLSQRSAARAGAVQMKISKITRSLFDADPT